MARPGLRKLAVWFLAVLATTAHGQNAAPAPATAPPGKPAPAAAAEKPPEPAAPKPGGETPAIVMDGNAADVILGKPVRNAKGDDLGRIVDVVVDRSGVVRAAIIDFGGFLGVGSRKIAIDWKLLRFPPEGALDRLIADLPQDQLRIAPLYRAGEPVVVVGHVTPPPPKAVPVAATPAAPAPAAPATPPATPRQPAATPPSTTPPPAPAPAAAPQPAPAPRTPPPPAPAAPSPEKPKPEPSPPGKP